MKQQLVDKFINEARTEHDTIGEYGFTRSEVEVLIANVVDHCITILEQEMDQSLEAGHADLYASLVDTAFKIMDEFGIDELSKWDEEELLRGIEGWKGQDDTT